MFIRRPIGIALAALFSLPAAADDFSATYFFGDSLTDSGYYKPLLGAAGAVVGKFTTNPGQVWSEDLAAALGTQAAPARPGTTGTNYAQGGARITGTPAFGVPAGFGTETITAQITRYLTSTGGKADPNALYAVWGGANDIFYAAQSLAATPAQIPNYLLATSAQNAGALKALQDAGARYIIVPTLPDIGATPGGVAQGASAAAGLTSMSSSYNSLLFGQLAANGVQAIPMDTFHLLREVAANPSAYGFVNATTPACGTTASLTCSPANLVAAGADQNYLFADGVHPTVGAHKVIADYVYAMLQAPAQISMLGETPVRTRSALTDTLLMTAGRAARGQGSGMWANAGGGQLKYEHSSDIAGADGTPYALTLGYDTPTNVGTVGVALNVGNYEPDLPGNGGGKYSQHEVSLSVYNAHRFGPITANLTATLGTLDFNTYRKVPLGKLVRSADGSTSGVSISAAAEVGYEFGNASFSHGPFVGFLAQRVSVKAFTESDAAGSSTVLSYGTQDRTAAVARLGYQVALDMGMLSPYGRLTVEHDFGDKERTIHVGMPSVYSGQYDGRGIKVDTDGATLIVGSGIKLSQSWTGWLELNGNFGRQDIDNYGLNAGIRYAF